MRLWDVIVIGAGPGGSTAAALLARQGFSVLVLERDDFPRFRIGESLLPAAQVVLEHLGVTPDPECFVFKRGAEFVCEATDRRAVFDFSEALPGPPRHAWHVERASFDTRLRDLARENGAVIEHGVIARDFRLAGDVVTLQTTSREGETPTQKQARYVIDGSGQGRLTARRRKSIAPYGCFGRSAAFVHFSNVARSTFDEFGDANDIRVMILDDGWAWVIPLPGRKLSIGLVSRNQGAKANDVLSYVASSPLLSRWTAGASRTEPTLVGNFSYKNTAPYGERFVCLGDAACFIDPVFSSGVSLAMAGALPLSERLTEALEAGTEADPELMRPFAEEMDRAYETFAALVYRFYHTHFVDRMIFGAPDDGDLRSSVTSVFAGDVFRHDNTFANMLLNQRRYPWREQPHAGQP